MKTFLQYISENIQSIAPHGVLVYGDKIYVGVEHGKVPDISPSLVSSIKEHGRGHGFFYEGTGPEVDIKQPKFGLSDIKDYKGGWDQKFEESQETYPKAFVSTMFANSNVNKQQERIAKIGKSGNHSSIFDTILHGHKDIIGWNFKGKLTAPILKSYLEDASSDSDIDFTKLAQMPPTIKNATKFIKEGDKRSYPNDWMNPKTRIAKLAQEADTGRNKHLLTSPPGVYFAGSGHIAQLANMLDERKENFTMHGGEDIEI